MTDLEFQRALSLDQMREALSLLDGAARAKFRNVQVGDSSPAEEVASGTDEGANTASATPNRLPAAEDAHQRRQHLNPAPNIGLLTRPNTRLKLWLIPGAFAMTLLTSGLALADDRLRNVTVVINRTEVWRYADNRSYTSDAPLKIYYASDGTAYVQFNIKHNGENIGVALAPNVSSGSYSYSEVSPSLGPQRNTVTASINGQMSSLNITFTASLCDADGRNCFYGLHGYILQLSGMTCNVIGGTTTMKSGSRAANPIVSASIMGPQRCSILSGRQLGG